MKTSTNHSLQWEPVRSGMVPLWSCQTYCWCARDVWLYRYHYDTKTLEKVFRLPGAYRGFFGRIKDWLARSVFRQWLKPGAAIHHLVETPRGDVVIVFDRVYLHPGQGSGRAARPLPVHEARSLSTPLRAGMAVHALSGRVYYGEYHDDPGGVRVVRVSMDPGLVDVCWHFPRSEIRHIHAIHYDRYRNRLWICTGDRDHESSLYYTDDEFGSVHRFAGGDQSWRAIAMLFDATGMEWGMDAGKDAPPEAVNRIFRYDFATKSRTELAAVGNPVYAACEFEDGTAVMQTSFEPGRPQDTCEEAALWYRDRSGGWRCILARPFQPVSRAGAGRYGAFWIPYGHAPSKCLLAVPVNCGRGSYVMHRLNWTDTHD